MTYCIGIALDDGLVFCSDSRTNAGIDQISSYSKMHTFGIDGERQFVLLSAGNLATTQAVVSQLRQDLRAGNDTPNLYTMKTLAEAADYIGEARLRRQVTSPTAICTATRNTIWRRACVHRSTRFSKV